jgi:hypothetical protein
LNERTAQALSHWKGSSLSLNGATVLDEKTAQALSHWKLGYLSLEGVTQLDEKTAQALATWKPLGYATELSSCEFYLREEIGDQNSVLWNLDEKKPRLYLKGLNTLEEASAKKLRSLANFLVVPPSFKPLLQKYHYDSVNKDLWELYKNELLSSIDPEELEFLSHSKDSYHLETVAAIYA